MTGFYLALLLPEPGCDCPYPKTLLPHSRVELPSGKTTHLSTECKACHQRVQVPVESVVLKPITMKSNGEIEQTK